MIYIDYTFRTAYDGSIIMDPDLKPEQLNVSEGDKFVVEIHDGVIILKKIRE
jgi:formylmethanofuran dehydrogenase subunit D